MSFIADNKALWRKLVPVLFIISMLGPWIFDLLNVPAQYPCGKPSVRLYGDFCGYPMSGFEVFTYANSGFLFFLDQLIKGFIAGRILDLIFPFSTWLIILPFFSTLLLIWNKNSRRLQTINLIAWGIACLVIFTVFILQTREDLFVRSLYLLWGIWLYLLVAIGTIIIEILVLRSDTRLSSDKLQ
jgi:hypothetical protein